MVRRFTYLAAALAVALGTMFTVVLSAHLEASRTMPANESAVAEAPARLQVWFTQQPSARLSRLDMKGPAGVVALGEIQVDSQDHSIAADIRGTLAPGSYEVAWRTAGDDGHVLRGTFTFSLNPAE